DLQLARGQARERETTRLEQLLRRTRDDPQEVAEHLRCDDPGTGGGGANSGGEHLWRQRLLAQVAERAGLHGGYQLVLGAVRGADEHARTRPLPQGADELARSGNVLIDQDDVGLHEGRILPRVLDGFGVCDRLDPVETGKASKQPASIDRMGIEDEDEHMSFLASVWRRPVVLDWPIR